MSRMDKHSQGKVPFSWEKKPGISKEESLKDSSDTYLIDPEYEHDVQRLPLPPCRSLPPRVSATKKGNKNQDDPFFTAYMECTKVPKAVTLKNDPDMYRTYSEYDHQTISQSKVVKGEYVHESASKNDLINMYRTYSEYDHHPLSRPKIVKGEFVHESASKKRQDDSFRECAKNGTRGKSIGNSKDDGVGFGISKNMSMFSCKTSCSVRNDSMVFIISKNSTSSKSKKEKGEMILNYDM